MFTFLQKLPQAMPAITVGANPTAPVGAAQTAIAFLETFGADAPTLMPPKQENSDLMGQKKGLLADADTDANIDVPPDPRCDASPQWPGFAQFIEMKPPPAFGLPDMATSTAIVVDQPSTAPDVAAEPEIENIALPKDSTGLQPAMGKPVLAANSLQTSHINAKTSGMAPYTPDPLPDSGTRLLQDVASPFPALLNIPPSPQTGHADAFSAKLQGIPQTNPVPTPKQIDAGNSNSDPSLQKPKLFSINAAVASGTLPQDVVLPPAKANAERLFSAVESAWRQKWMGGDSPMSVPTQPSNGAAVVQSTADLPQLSPLRPQIVLPPAGNQDVAKTAVQATKFLTGDIAIPQQTNQHAQYLPEIPGSDNIVKIYPASNGQINQKYDATVDDLTDHLHDVGRVAQSLGQLPQAGNLTMPVGLAKPNVYQVVAPTIFQLAKAKNAGPVELSLSPEELGRLTISMKYHGDFVHVTVNADRPETLDLMRRHANELVADLRQAGFSGSSLSFGQGGKGHHPHAMAAAPHAELTSSTPQQSPPEIPTPRPAGPANALGIDLRF